MNELIERAQNGDEEAMTKIINENVGLVWNVVKRFYNRGYDKEDLFQIGCLGFIKAIKRFNLEFENKLSTYAVTMIIGEIKRFLRDDGMVKVSRSLKENASKIREIQETTLKNHGIELTIEEISEKLEISKEDIVLAMEATSYVDSLDKTITGEKDDDTVGEKIVMKDNDYDKVIDKMAIESMLEILDENERRIIIYRYYREMTQAQVARIIGTSQVQVSRIEIKALAKMHDNMCQKI